MSRNNDISRTLLKIDHLTDLGLELFPDTGKFGNELKSGTLECLLLNGESETFSVPNVVPDDFDTYHDYASHDMPSLLPSEQNAELIEVFPVTDTVLVETAADITDNHKERDVALNLANDVSDLKSASKRKILPSVNDAPTRTKYKVHRTVGQRKFKKKVMARMANPGKFGDEINRRPSNFGKRYNDNTELDNKINDTLLDMLQAKTRVGRTSLTGPDRPLSMGKNGEKHCYKFITILPPKPDGKIINLMVKGKCCRSKQQLTESELRVVTKILSNECANTENIGENSHRNVYYDAETDTNIRYEVQYESVSEDNMSYHQTASSNPSGKKTKRKAFSEGSNKEGYVLNGVARTRCGRISRPPRHVIRDYKRLNESNNGMDDENESNGGYADYRSEDTNAVSEIQNTEPATASTLFGPLEPNKRQFSSLSRCPTCNKIYLGYRRMAIHFQKYPEHKNEELLKHLLIRNNKKTLEGSNGLNNMTDNGLTTSPNDIPGPSVCVNGAVKKNGRLYRRLRFRGSKSHQLKELLGSFRIEDIIKYASPMVANALDSWKYLLLRSRKTKSDGQTLIASLLNEIGVVIQQLRSISGNLLRPCEEDKENLPNIFTVKEGDVLQYILGLTPGKYITSEDESWMKDYSESSCRARKQDLKDEYAALCSSTVNSDEDVSDLPDNQSNMNQRNDAMNPFYQTLTQQVPSAVSVTDLVQNTKKYPISASCTISTQPSDLNDNEHFDYSDDTSKLFGNLKSNIVSSINGEESSHLSLKSNDNNSNLTVDYIQTSFSPSHALNFDSFVDDVDDDLMNAFPISLPMLSDNSTNNKDYGDILNSLKGIECAAQRLTMPDSSGTMTNINMSESSSVDLLSTLKNIDGGDKAIPTTLNTVANDSDQTSLLDSLKSMGQKMITPNLDRVVTQSLSESSQMGSLTDLKIMNNSNNSHPVQMRSDNSNNLTEESDPPCIIDFVSLDS